MIAPAKDRPVIPPPFMSPQVSLDQGVFRLLTTRLRRAFSLTELLVVIAVLGILAGFAIPAATNILRANDTTRAGAVIEQAMLRARQLALSQNRKVEVRLYKYNDSLALGDDAQYRGLQIVRIEEDGTAKAAGKVQSLPSGAVINESSALSPLITELTTKQGSAGLRVSKAGENGRDYEWIAVTFLPDGSTDLDESGGESGKWFVTVHDGIHPVSDGTPPSNYYTVQIEPLLGSVRGYRP